MDEQTSYRNDGGSAGAPLASSKRILFFTQRESDRRARQVESIAQSIDEITPVSIRQRIGAGAGQNEAGRPGLRLRDVIELQPTPGYCRWRMLRQGVTEPAIKRSGGHAFVPDRVTFGHSLQQAVDALS